jgi:hypothetical protein
MPQVMSYLHRAALTITRKQPYVDWANRTGDGTDEQVVYPQDDRRTVYLVPNFDGDTTPGEVLAEFWEDIFEEELAAWVEDEESWPEVRTRAVFDAWFDADLTDAVIDLTPDEPLTSADLELTDVSYALLHCAWCDLELEPQEGRSVGFKVPNREHFALREGLTLPLPINEERVVVGILTAADSPAAEAGDDYVFRACTSHCDKMLRKHVPRALQRLPV